MKVFKFGGASIRSAAAVRNMVNIVRNYLPDSILVVVSAMGKTTNMLEDALHGAAKGKVSIDNVLEFHTQITEELGIDSEIIKPLLQQLEVKLGEVNSTSMAYHYDQVVSMGEMLSSSIICHYLIAEGIPCERLHAPDLIVTDDNWTRPLVQWDETRSAIGKKLKDANSNMVYLTQGFIGGSGSDVTTLGREGSDYSAAIFAVALQAPSLTVWKDVPGIMNADPKRIPQAVLYNELSYKDASEMTYYGAKVIHPDTIRPLADTGTELYVRSFTQPEARGTRVFADGKAMQVPCIIYKENQCIISFRITDFEFVDERHLVMILDYFHDRRIPVNLMQNSAISFSLCIDYDESVISEIRDELNETFEIHYNTNLTLLTIKSYDEESIATYKPHHILMEQKTRADYQVVYRHEPQD